ncbi:MULTISPECIES: type II toxin-antitoxin system RelB/DinJ family antitoxin [unclassified Sedimentibacter]|uniref:type II toxin-antitoxin system RelB/DinJ family antitoxin n=1 Tax=unclassified Sedimentibacter TaxID=2649220 RepID=UPI0027E17C55|nr:type II toxin-antitoxin system RelB/DinJ family antitoxin [Sedimentibacter sp. MB35-C1]WMJ75737.1 type II toxin-antitoxin system RelB/DinJ family antitoxin [Sedimentibacter sp. MB35-C1]
MSKTYIQVRAEESDKELASEILEKLGTNLSTVVNMLLKQIIMTKSIPFEVKLNETSYAEDEAVSEIVATLAMENMNLTKEDILLLKEYRNDKSSADKIRKKIISEYTKE